MEGLFYGTKQVVKLMEEEIPFTPACCGIKTKVIFSILFQKLFYENVKKLNFEIYQRKAK